MTLSFNHLSTSFERFWTRPSSTISEECFLWRFVLIFTLQLKNFLTTKIFLSVSVKAFRLELNQQKTDTTDLKKSFKLFSITNDKVRILYALYAVKIIFYYYTRLPKASAGYTWPTNDRILCDSFIGGVTYDQNVI